MAENPVFPKETLFLLHKLLKLDVVLVILQIESKSHRRINFGEMDLFRDAFMELEMILLDLPTVARNSFDSSMRVEEDQALLLHPYKEIGLSWSPTNDTNIELLHEEGSDCSEVLV